MVRLSLFHAILALAVVSSALPTQQDAQADQGAMDAAANAAPKPRPRLPHPVKPKIPKPNETNPPNPPNPVSGLLGTVGGLLPGVL